MFLLCVTWCNMIWTICYCLVPGISSFPRSGLFWFQIFEGGKGWERIVGLALEIGRGSCIG